MVEQRPFKPKVVGSIPTAPTTPYLIDITSLTDGRGKQPHRPRKEIRPEEEN